MRGRDHRRRRESLLSPPPIGECRCGGRGCERNAATRCCRSCKRIVVAKCPAHEASRQRGTIARARAVTTLPVCNGLTLPTVNFAAVLEPPMRADRGRTRETRAWMTRSCWSCCGWLHRPPLRRHHRHETNESTASEKPPGRLKGDEKALAAGGRLRYGRNPRVA